MRGFFIAGTDTGVGKTQVGRALCSLLAARGLAPRALKPVETGCQPDRPLDALALREACKSEQKLDDVCPYRFRLPAAPLAAAEAEGREIDVLRIEELVAFLGEPLVVEAAGGLMVPLARASRNLEQMDPPDRPASRAILTNLDLADRLGLPVILVARAGLGTLNHSTLSVIALEERGIPLAGVVLNRVEPQDDPSVSSNARFLEELTGARILGPTPFVADAAARPAALRTVLEPLVDTWGSRR